MSRRILKEQEDQEKEKTVHLVSIHSEKKRSCCWQINSWHLHRSTTLYVDTRYKSVITCASENISCWLSSQNCLLFALKVLCYKCVICQTSDSLKITYSRGWSKTRVIARMWISLRRSDVNITEQMLSCVHFFSSQTRTFLMKDTYSQLNVTHKFPIFNNLPKAL